MYKRQATERERAAKVFTDMEGTELYEKLMTGSSEMSIRIKGPVSYTHLRATLSKSQSLNEVMNEVSNNTAAMVS